MKAFLMYPDRDFAARETLTPNQATLVQDLGLDALFDTMSNGDDVLRAVAARAVLNGVADRQTIEYRQEIVRDCLEQSDVVRHLYDIVVDAIVREKKSFWGLFSKNPSINLHRSVDVLEMFLGVFKELRALADEKQSSFRSTGFVRLFTMLRQELNDDYLDQVAEHLQVLKFRNGVLISVQLSDGNKGDHYVLRRRPDVRHGLARLLSDTPHPSYTYRLPPRDEAGSQAMGELKARGINLVSNALAQSTDHILDFFKMLRTELAFYIGCLNLGERLGEKGEPFCFPVPENPGSQKMDARDLYDVCFSLMTDSPMVGNDVAADGRPLVIITGANQGGKSTLLRATGTALLMMQSGMFVPATSLQAGITSGVFTHYRREEDATMTSGKLDEELARMSEIVDQLTPNALVLFNESFAATNEREGSELARNVVHALLESGVTVFFVSHQFDFAHSFYLNGSDSTLFLRAERQVDGERTFKLTEQAPLPTSYGPDLYEKIFEPEPAAQQGDSARPDQSNTTDAVPSDPASSDVAQSDVAQSDSIQTTT